MTGIRTHSKHFRPGILFPLSVAFFILPFAAWAADEPAAEAGATQVENPAAGDPTASDPAIVSLDDFIEKANVDKSYSEWKSNLQRPPMAAFSADKSYFWNLKTNKGDIKIRLMPEVAPMHVSSTIYLTRLGFYDDLIFHRVITGFMAQGGDPTGTGRGGPGYQYQGEFDRLVKHNKPGMLSMANAGPGTDGSQFFLTFIPTPSLDGKHTIFGEVVEGMRTVKALEKAGSRQGKTKEKLNIETATISVE